MHFPFSEGSGSCQLLHHSAIVAVLCLARHQEPYAWVRLACSSYNSAKEWQLLLWCEVTTRQSLPFWFHEDLSYQCAGSSIKELSWSKCSTWSWWQRGSGCFLKRATLFFIDANFMQMLKCAQFPLATCITCTPSRRPRFQKTDPNFQSAEGRESAEIRLAAQGNIKPPAFRNSRMLPKGILLFCFVESLDIQYSWLAAACWTWNVWSEAQLEWCPPQDPSR